MRVLVTGATGYIGSHAVLQLLENKYQVVAVDNFSNSTPAVLKIMNKLACDPFIFEEIDVADYQSLMIFLRKYPCDAVIHFAGYKSVAESITNPVSYYENNLRSTINIVKAFSDKSLACGKKIIFSSSANIYGNSTNQPIKESFPVGMELTSPYGRTKYFSECILRDAAVADANLQAVSLRYFNPIGAHPSGELGEVTQEAPSNISPAIIKVALGQQDEVKIFGNDYPTEDGTGIRDYIHVMDLVDGHIAALKYEQNGFHAFNLGTCQGTSVFELISAFEKVSGRPIPFKIYPRRVGDIAVSIADPSKAAKELNWKSTRSLEQACQSAWKWNIKE